MRLIKTIIQYIYSSLSPSPEKRLRRRLIRLNWSDFEIYITEMFTRYGYYKAYRTGRDGPDGGKDVVIEHHDKRYLVQCKHWTRDQVGITLLREFYAVILENGADGGYFVTLAGYTLPALKYASNKPIRLISLDTLIDWERQSQLALMDLAEIEIHDPLTPRCNAGVMKVKREARTGYFWGCGEWPECYCRKNEKIKVGK